jgi:hypothetical protein
MAYSTVYYEPTTLMTIASFHLQGRHFSQLCARRRLGHLQLCFSTSDEDTARTRTCGKMWDFLVNSYESPMKVP